MSAGPTRRGDPSAPRSERGRLARLAAEAAASTAGVVRLDGGDPLARTRDRDGWIEGVACIAEPDGRYGLAVHLVIELVEVDRVARAVRERTIARADDHGLGELVGSIRIVIEGIETQTPDLQPSGGAR